MIELSCDKLINLDYDTTVTENRTCCTQASKKTPELRVPLFNKSIGVCVCVRVMTHTTTATVRSHSLSYRFECEQTELNSRRYRHR